MGLQTVVASSATALATALPSPADGQPATIRIGGSSQDSFDVPMIWNAAMGNWVGINEYDIVRSVNELDAQPQATVTTKQVLASNTNNAITGGDVLSNCVPIRLADAATSAGLRFQYRHGGFLFPSSDPQVMNAGTVFFTATTTGTYDTTYADAYAETAYLASTTSGYTWQESGWTTLLTPALGALGVAPNPVLYAMPWGFMTSPAAAAGGVNSYTCWLRFII